jgi:hypothetical protein
MGLCLHAALVCNHSILLPIFCSAVNLARSRMGPFSETRPSLGQVGSLNPFSLNHFFIWPANLGVTRAVK